jgi:flagellar hook-associated protein 1 FlgK
MLGLTTGLSALQVSQRALDIVGQNIANANTPGYHRQVLNLSTRFPVEIGGQSIGTGVQITDVRRLHSQLLESALAQHASESGDAASQLETLRHIESLLTTGEGSIHDTMEKFFNGLEQLSTRPGEVTLRRTVLGTASALSSEFNYVGGEFDRIRTDMKSQIESVVTEVNSLAREIADLNESIQRSAARDVTANDLLDQREQLTKQLAELTGIRMVEADQSQLNIFLEGWPLVVANQATTLGVSKDTDGNTIVTRPGSDDGVAIHGGKLGALLTLQNSTVPAYQERLELLAHEFIRAINNVHATGVGLNGPFSFLDGVTSVSDTTVPLTQAGLAFPPQAGSLFMNITNTATGQRTLVEIAVDPATQSLDDLATTISGVTGVQAIADAQTGSLQILAESGYAFDFSGQLQTDLNSVAVTGTSVPQVAGTYTGTTNDTYTFRVVGSGTVGVTPDLSLKVRNSAGTVIGSINIGQGYEPGKSIAAVNGLTVQMTAGSVNDGDNFTARVIGQPDTAGILPALGLGTLFTGAGALDIRVNDKVMADPTQFAAARSGMPGDGSNLARMIAVRDQPLLGNGTQSLRDGYAALVTDVASSVQNLSERQSHQELLGQRLEAERQSISGVDTNEEMVKMVQFQRSFQMAAKYINVVSQTLDELARIV